MQYAETVTCRLQMSHTDSYGVDKKGNLFSTLQRRHMSVMVTKILAITWWRHQMETCSALRAICVGNSLVTGEFPSQRPVTWNFDAFFYLRLIKQSSAWWFETPSCPLWHHSNKDCLFNSVLRHKKKAPYHCPFVRGNIARSVADSSHKGVEMRKRFSVFMLCGHRTHEYWSLPYTSLYGLHLTNSGRK